MPSYEFSFLKALVITVLAEMLMGGFLLKFFPKHFSFQVKIWEFFLFIGAVSFMTLPYVWFIWPFLVHGRSLYLVTSETWVWLMESMFYVFAFRTDIKKALLFSLLLNSVSLGLGFLIKL